tara:strand:- start:1398 stop:2009 length:612 start_codon:yes stop_codon:yes gene_type:complete
MAIKFTISNILQLFSTIAPLLLGFFLVMASIFNQNVKGLIYLAGVLIASIINILLMNQLKVPFEIDKAASVCSILEVPYMSAYNTPSPSAVFIAFTLIYLVIPMSVNKQMNYGILITILCLLGLDIVTKAIKKCTSWVGGILGMVVGMVLGACWYAIFHIAGLDSLLYFDEVSSNNVICSKPSSQTFKCSVYKNGELISSNIA